MTVEMKKYKLGDIAYITKLAGFEHSKYIQDNCSHEKRPDFIPLFIGRTVKNGCIDENFDCYDRFGELLTKERSQYFR